MPATEKRLAMAEKVRRAKDEDGLTFTEVARHLRISYAYANTLYHDPRGDQQRKRRDGYTGICERCGGKTRSDGTSHPSRTCASCAVEIQHENRKWTRETVIDAIRRFAAKHGRPPVSTEWITSDPENGYPAAASCFGPEPHQPFAKWADAVEAAGYPRPALGRYVIRPRPPRPSRQEILDRIREHAVDGVAPPSKLYSTLAKQASREFGTWNQAVEAAGLTCRPARRWSRETIIEWIRVRSVDGIAPASKSETEIVPILAARRLFGSWKDACQAAGVTSRRAAGVMGRRVRLWSRPAVLDGIRASADGDFPPVASENPSLAAAARRLYGSWAAAVRAAGYEPYTRGGDLRATFRREQRLTQANT